MFYNATGIDFKDGSKQLKVLTESDLFSQVDPDPTKCVISKFKISRAVKEDADAFLIDIETPSMRYSRVTSEHWNEVWDLQKRVVDAVWEFNENTNVWHYLTDCVWHEAVKDRPTSAQWQDDQKRKMEEIESIFTGICLPMYQPYVIRDLVRDGYKENWGFLSHVRFVQNNIKIVRDNSDLPPTALLWPRYRESASDDWDTDSRFVSPAEAMLYRDLCMDLADNIAVWADGWDRKKIREGFPGGHAEAFMERYHIFRKPFVEDK